MNEHGTWREYRRGCSCDECREAWRVYCQERNRARGVRPREEWLAEQRKTATHPSISAYQKRGCRCAECRALMAARKRRLRARTPERVYDGGETSAPRDRANGPGSVPSPEPTGAEMHSVTQSGKASEIGGRP